MPKMKLSPAALLASLGIIILLIAGCTNKLLRPESFYQAAGDKTTAGISGPNIIASKVTLGHYGDHGPVDIENINQQIIKKLNARSLEINSESVKNKSNEQIKKKDVTTIPDQVQDLYSIETQVFNMINHLRIQKGMQKLNLNPVVTNIARLRSTDMVNRNYFSHYTPEGKHTTAILSENGVMYASSAEILYRASPPSWGPPETIINTWLGSNIHRDIIFTPQFSQVGISIVDGGNKRVVTVIFLN